VTWGQFLPVIPIGEVRTKMKRRKKALAKKTKKKLANAWEALDEEGKAEMLQGMQFLASLKEKELKELFSLTDEAWSAGSYLQGKLNWTYRIVGCYLRPTIEEWSDLYISGGDGSADVLAKFEQLAFAFIAYHDRKRLPLRSFDEEADLVNQILHLLAFGTADDEPTEADFLLECSDLETNEYFQEDSKQEEELFRLAKTRFQPWMPPSKWDKYIRE
jgi:hypothetical protein